MHYGNLARAADRLIVYWDGSNELIYGALCPAGAAGKFVEEYKP